MTSSLVYFNLENVWNQLFVPVLNNRRVKAIRYKILKEISEIFNGEITDLYHWDANFFNRISSLTERDKIHEINRHGWGKFSGYEEFTNEFIEEYPEIYNEWLLISNDDFDDPNTIGHYLYNNRELTTCLLWAWCKAIWPEKNFKIIQGSYLTFVMEDNDPHTIYSLFDYKVGTPLEDFEEVLESLPQTYSSPAQFLPQYFDPNYVYVPVQNPDLDIDIREFANLIQRFGNFRTDQRDQRDQDDQFVLPRGNRGNRGNQNN
jgi:hypothetical protein